MVMSGAWASFENRYIEYSIFPCSANAYNANKVLLPINKLAITQISS